MAFDGPVLNETTATGGCACEGVRYRIVGDLRNVSDCHCEPCRRITGHHMAATAAPSDKVSFESDATLRWYDSTPTVQYGFCGNCGSSLFWRAADKPGHLSITAGSLDHPTGLRTDVALFVDEAGDYHRLDTDMKMISLDRLRPEDNEAANND